jgi:alanyl-tRNA synthetase
VTGRGAYELVQKRFRILKQAARTLSAAPDEVAELVESTVQNLSAAEKEIETLRQKIASLELNQALEQTKQVEDVHLLTAILEDADMGALLQMGDRFRQKYPRSGVAVLGAVSNGKPTMVAVVTEDLVRRGIKAGDLVEYVAQQVGGGGGGRPTLAQAGGKDPERLKEALDSVHGWVKDQLG